jgi:hypothetical protein
MMTIPAVDAAARVSFKSFFVKIFSEFVILHHALSVMKNLSLRWLGKDSSLRSGMTLLTIILD